MNEDKMKAFVIWILLFVCSLSHGAKLNTPRVLLPYNFQNNPVVYTLEVTETTSECFVWSSLQEDAVLVEPVETGGCSNKATVTAISRQSSTQKVIVLAEDRESGVVLRCDVIVDTPRSLLIATTTREIYVEEAAEEFELIAMDEQGNQFTSLDGVSFQWSVKAVGGGQPVIRIQPFAESSYDTSPAIEALERRGLRGDKVLLVGTATGVAVVSARLQHAQLGDLETPGVRLSSVANLLLQPPDAFVLPGTRVPYAAVQVKHGRLHPVRLDASPYYLDVRDAAVGRLEKGSSTVTALKKGNTEVTLRDSNAEGGDTGASARLSVVEPASLTVTSPSHADWVAVTGQRVRLQCHLWDALGNRLWIGENVVVELTVEEEYFSMDLTSDNGTYAEGTTVSTGHAKIRARLTGYRVPDGSEHRLAVPLEATATLEIYPPLAVVPELVVLPWNPQTAPAYNIQLNYTGGDGSVAWSSNNSHLATVSQQGVLRTRGRGHCTVTVSLVRNPRIKAHAQVYVVPVAELSLPAGPREAEVGAPLLVPVALHARLEDGRRVSFTRCHQVALNVQLSNERFVTGPEDESAGEAPPGACRQVSLRGVEPGHARVTVSLLEPWPTAEAGALVGTYRPLTVAPPADGAGLLLAPRSSWLLQADGGPLPWPTRPDRHQATAVSSVDAVSVAEVAGADGFWRLVLCRAVGEARLQLTVGNRPSAELPRPAVSRAEVLVRCAMPRRLLLTAEQPVAAGRQPLELPACPLQQPLRAHAGQPLPLLLRCEDADGAAFHNASSLALAWSESSSGSLARLEPAGGAAAGPGALPAAERRSLVPAGRPGELTVRAVMTAPQGAARLEAELALRLVTPLQASPAQLVVFNHPATREAVQLTGGSGHVAVRVATPAQSSLAAFTFHPENSSVSVAPRADGRLTLDVWDLCLTATPPATVAVQISGVTGVELSVVGRLALGSKTVASVAVLGASGTRLPARLLPLLNVRLEPASSVLAVRYQSAGPDDTHLYEVRGEAVGDVTLTARAGATAASDRRVEVFPPLRLSPRNRTVAVGSQYQLAASGGPRADTDVWFSSSERTAAEVSASGLVTARRPGSARLTGQVADGEPATGDHTVYSEDTVSAHVVQLCGVRLRAPLTRIQRGQRQPLYADGLDQHGAVFVIKSPVPGVTFRWSSSYPQTAAVSSPLSPLCVDSDEGVAMRMSALEPGKAQLSVTLAFGDGLRPVGCPADLPTKATLHVTVYEELRVLSPPVPTGSVLMSPHSRLSLRTTLPAVATSAEGLVSVSGSELVAGPRTGRDTLRLTATGQPGGNQTAALLLELLPVHYVMVTPVAELCVADGAGGLPTGLTLRLNVTAHDTRGRPFAAWLGAAPPAASRADLLQAAGTATLVTAQLRRPGTVSLSVAADADPALSDVLFVDIADLVPPEQAHLTVGDVTCLTSPVTPAGQWRSDSPDTVEVTAEGALVARRPGSAAVTLTTESGQQARSRITVQPVTQVWLSRPVSVGAVAACGRESYRLPLNLSGESPVPPPPAARCSPAALERLTAASPASCRLSLSRPAAGVSADQLFLSRAVLSADTVGYQCELTPLCPAGAAAARIAADLVLTAEVSPGGGQSAVRSTPLTVPLMPPVHPETTELRLGGAVVSTELSVLGARDLLSSVTAAVTDSRLLQASAPRRDGERLVVTVSLRPAAWLPGPRPADLALLLTVAASGQTVSVPVRLAATDASTHPPPPPAGWGHVLWLLLGQYWSSVCSLLTALGAATLVYLLLRQLRPPAAAPAPAPSASPAKTPPPQFGSPPPPYHADSPVRTHLWTDDKGPIYGSPSLVRRSPYDPDRSRGSPYANGESPYSPRW
ncbi:Nuclear pore membrane glycoprotein 210 [Amphibalanus amphitrite]|uniref:Nuclear pore membrane glycoprotein 210 n=1 Tax=Amphibalanus amphitrite TaxID=1232801 RepID=A0A6A4WR32_AMPAM|nr:nuclear pore membrane glycoprotein 210-like [Amphibalanus amphitrite]KAF0309747.1 Nuclear pore membrane glycoprotein 210 [Amphibalanus amphitrite]